MIKRAGNSVSMSSWTCDSFWRWLLQAKSLELYSRSTAEEKSQGLVELKWRMLQVSRTERQSLWDCRSSGRFWIWRAETFWLRCVRKREKEKRWQTNRRQYGDSFRTYCNVQSLINAKYTFLWFINTYRTVDVLQRKCGWLTFVWDLFFFPLFRRFFRWRRRWEGSSWMSQRRWTLKTAHTTWDCRFTTCRTHTGRANSSPSTRWANARSRSRRTLYICLTCKHVSNQMELFLNPLRLSRVSIW